MIKTGQWLAALVIGLSVVAIGGVPTARAQGVDLENRPVADIRVEGLKQVPLKLVNNSIRIVKGGPYQAKVVQEDIVRITHLGRGTVQAKVEPQPDGSVVLTYVVTEQPLLSDVQIVGNKKLNDQELLQLGLLKAGDPVDQFLIDRAIQEIKRAYEKAGYFVAQVTADKPLLDKTGILIFRVREGPRVKIRGIRFTGNTAFSAGKLRSKIKSNTYMFIFRKGELNRDQLDGDEARLRDFYRDRGYLDAQVGRRIDISSNQKSAVVNFVIQEGKQYTVAKITVDGNKVYPSQQIIETMLLKVGDVYSADKLRKSTQAVTDLYGKLGYIEGKIEIQRLFHQDQPKVDLIAKIDEGSPATVGKVSIRGNQLTKDKVVYRQVRGMEPGRRFDKAGIEKTEQRLKESSLFNEGNVTVLGGPNDPIRDVLVEVKEQNTGSLSFGAGISSDAGVVGAIDLVQRNFDIADYPQSLTEFLTGKSFRGAGQYFAINLQPGIKTSQYSVSFREPYLFETDYFLDTNIFYYERKYTNWDEKRIGGTVGIGQRFGDVWSAAVRARAEQVDITNIAARAPVDVFQVQGPSIITSLGPTVSRNTTDSRLFPTRGSNLVVSVSRAGALGGDYDFTQASEQFTKYWTVDEDFFGRRTVLSWRLETGYTIDGDAPEFERFYAGGHRSFRGFDFRGVGPRGLRGDYFFTKKKKVFGDDPVGGRWLFLTGLEYNFPIYEEILRGVLFTDTGTVQDRFGFDEYRVSIGAGIRIKIPFLGQAPFALDFAFPLRKEPGDKAQVFSFDLAVPF